jgi:AP-2 complex subunit sigma-1
MLDLVIPPLSLSLQYQSFKLIYRRYAGLYFVFGADASDNELLLMETIHLFVELLDQYFSNVCEVNRKLAAYL